MHIVIDIPEDIIIKAIKYDLLDVTYNAHDLCVCIMNGTPLPKGHGRLIDADELKKHKYHDDNRCENAVSVAQIDWQPTIIEADNED